ncbi:MAG: class B sortase [Ethanoligenens sp.]
MAGADFFFWQLIPHRRDEPAEIFRKIVFLVALIVFIGCMVPIAQYYLDAYQNQRMNNNIAAHVRMPASAASTAAGSVLPEYASLYAQNNDMKGWVSVPGTNINYPVMQASDNDFYLRRDFYKNSNQHGVPFLDYRDKLGDAPSKNLIIYGHNMKDDQMFHELVNYEDDGFYEKAPLIQFNTLYKRQTWKIFAVLIANVQPSQGDTFYYLDTDFSSDETFMNYIGEVKKRSLVNTSVDVQPTDRILTLSTCSYVFNDARVVVLARLVRDGESSVAGSAVKNPDPQMPQIWYKVTKSSSRQ